MINCVTHDYLLSINGLEAQPKEATTGKTDRTIQRLFELSQNDLAIEKTYDLAQFSSALSQHLETSIRRRYSIFSWFVLFFSKNWGALKQLLDVKQLFDKAVGVKKERLIQEVPTPKILASIFYVDSDFCTHDPEVNRCYRQLHEQKLFPAHETIQLAWFISKTPLTETRYKKNPELNLPRSFHRDPATGRIFIRNKSAQIAKTDVKTVTKAILYSPEEVRVVAQLTTPKGLDAAMQKRTFNEYTTYKKYQACPGLWPMLHATEYNGRVALFSELASGDFERLGKTLTFDDLVKRSKTLLEGLEWLHRHDLLHIDAKGANALLGDAPKAGWIDLSFAGSLADPKILARLKSGHYGTRCFTAPELFGVEGFRSRQKEAEMWAFGLMLFHARFKHYPKWFAKKLTDKDREMSQTLKDAYNQAISDEILPALAALLAKSTLTAEEQFELIIYKLLHPDPTKRLSAENALKELENLTG